MIEQAIDAVTGSVVNAAMSRAYLAEETGQTLHCEFNPSQLAISQSADWTPAVALNAMVASIAEFRSSQPRTLSLELFFDRSTIRLAQTVASARSGLDPTSRSVQPDIERLMAMTRPVPDSDPPQPPVVTFGWGLMNSFRGYVKSVQATYLLFGRSGYPYRAKARVEFIELATAPRGQNPTSGAERSRKTHRVSPGDSLQSIAFSAYGNPVLWRGLAEVNGIDDPLRLRIGDELLLPEEDELQELS